MGRDWLGFDVVGLYFLLTGTWVPESCLLESAALLKQTLKSWTVHQVHSWEIGDNSLKGVTLFLHLLVVAATLVSRSGENEPRHSFKDLLRPSKTLSLEVASMGIEENCVLLIFVLSPMSRLTVFYDYGAYQPPPQESTLPRVRDFSGLSHHVQSLSTNGLALLCQVPRRLLSHGQCVVCHYRPSDTLIYHGSQYTDVKVFTVYCQCVTCIWHWRPWFALLG